jgi:hypothetical protein
MTDSPRRIITKNLRYLFANSFDASQKAQEIMADLKAAGLVIIEPPPPSPRGNPKARNTDPVESHGGAQEGEKWGSYRILAARCYYQHGGLTDREVCIHLGWDTMAEDGHRRRCSDLRQAEIDKESGVVIRPALTERCLDFAGQPMSRRNPGPFGRMAGVYNFTAEALEWLDEHHPGWRGD